MPMARKHQININETPYYHCIGRCVRRAFLCGLDPLTQKSYEHRRTWLVDKLLELTDIFAISVCAYAVMSNHYHVVLRVNEAVMQQWSADEIVARYHRLNRSRFGRATEPTLVPANDSLSADDINTYRHKLIDISSFMGVLNEYIARRANQEDECKGRFWEGRFKSYALLDEAALFICMAYVDLNPLRGGLSTSLENSDFTSIQQRLKASPQPEKAPATPPGLAPFRAAHTHDDTPGVIPCSFQDYAQLVKWTSHHLREGKTGYVPAPVNTLFVTCGINETGWLSTLKSPKSHFSWAIGSVEKLKRLAARQNRRWLQGARHCRSLYTSKPIEPLPQAGALA
jgi:putative transposase